jgi:hypothetical protein
MPNLPGYFLLHFYGFLAAFFDPGQYHEEELFVILLEQNSVPYADLPQFTHLLDELLALGLAGFQVDPLLSRMVGIPLVQINHPDLQTIHLVPVLKPHASRPLYYSEQLSFIRQWKKKTERDSQLGSLRIVPEGCDSLTDADVAAELKTGHFGWQGHSETDSVFLYKAIRLFELKKYADVIAHVPLAPPSDAFLFVRAAANVMLGLPAQAKKDLQLCVQQETHSRDSARQTLDDRGDPKDPNQPDIRSLVRAAIRRVMPSGPFPD